MKFEYWNAIKTSTWFKLLVATAVSYVLYLLAGFMLPILLAIGLAFGLYPLVNMITQVRVAHGMIKLSRAVAIVLALIGFLIFLCIAIGFIILPLFGQMNDLLVKLPALAAKSNIQDLDTMLQDPSKIPMLPSSFEMLTDGLINWAMGFVGNVLAFYFLKDWRDLRSMFINLFNYDVQDRVAQVVDDIGRTLSSYVRGLVKLSLISGFVITIGTAFLGIDFPLVLGFWAILAETVPVVGPIMGAVPAIFIAYGQSPEAALHVAIFYAVYYQLDANFLMPKIMGQRLDLHPVLVIGSLLIGAKLFGILGMVFAVPVAAIYRVLYKELWHAEEEQVTNS